MDTPAPVNAVVDHEAGTVTVAVTFRWQKGNGALCLDTCEATSFTASMREGLVAWLNRSGYAAPNGPITGFSYQCFEPNEERTLGYLADYKRATCAGCGAPAVLLHAAPWFAHVAPSECLHFTDGKGDADGNAVSFANHCDVTFPIGDQT